MCNVRTILFNGNPAIQFTALPHAIVYFRSRVSAHTDESQDFEVYTHGRELLAFPNCIAQ
jgi:hypothetical protein